MGGRNVAKEKRGANLKEEQNSKEKPVRKGKRKGTVKIK